MLSAGQSTFQSAPSGPSSAIAHDLIRFLMLLVPRGRVELPLSCENRILSPARLPVPPSGHVHVRDSLRVCF